MTLALFAIQFIVERRPIVDLLRHAPVWLGVREDRDPVGGDRGNDGGVLLEIESYWLAHAAVFGMGQLRECAELRDLADERVRVAVVSGAS